VKNPLFIVFAGPNGSGKSTFKDFQSEFDLSGIEYVNPDVITRAKLGLGLSEPFPSLGEKYYQASKAAQAEAAHQRLSAIKARRSFCFETVMSHESKIDDMAHAKAAGFHVVLFFLGLDDPRLNVQRVRERVHEGGHPVDEIKIITRYFRCMALLDRAIRISNVAFIYDTSTPNQPFDAVARVNDGKSLEVSESAGKPYWACEYLLKPFGLWNPDPRESSLHDQVGAYFETGTAPKVGARRRSCMEVAAEVGRAFQLAFELELPRDNVLQLSNHVRRMASHRLG
jgi:predicted ABC-type ATPase